jgi:hypothetical protein
MRFKYGAWHARYLMSVSLARLKASDLEMRGAMRCNGQMCAVVLIDECMRSTFLIRDVIDQMMLIGLVQDIVLLELSIMHCMPFSGTA